MPICDFVYCVYQQNGSCVLSSVDINHVGMCDSAIVIDLPEEELWRRKMELVAKLKSYEDEYRR